MEFHLIWAILGLLCSRICKAVPVAQHQSLSLHTYPEARCLDGSPGAYYFRPGSGDGASKVIFFMEGGGFCTSLEDCASRAKQYLGSTMHDNPTRSMNEPYFSNIQLDNPLFCNWNYVFMRYCDGGYFAGDSWGMYGLEKLYFRGLSILKAGVAESMKLNPTEIVVAGCSAGGIATIAQVDAIHALFKAQPGGDALRVTGFADSGFYLDTPYYTPVKKFVTQHQRALQLLQPGCLKANPSKPWRCFVAEINAQYLKTPTFAWESRYDTDQRGCEMPPACASSPSCVNDYGKNLSTAIHTQLLSPAGRGHGSFIDSCARHCWNGEAPWSADLNGRRLTMLQAHHLWYVQKQSLVLVQEGRYPCADCCKATLPLVQIPKEVIV